MNQFLNQGVYTCHVSSMTALIDAEGKTTILLTILGLVNCLQVDKIISEKNLEGPSITLRPQVVTQFCFSYTIAGALRDV